MKKFVLLVLVAAMALSAAFGIDFAKIDDLYFHQEIDKVQQLLEAALKEAKGPDEKSAVLWRLARNCIDMGDRMPEDAKKERFAMFEKGEDYADQSLAAKETAYGCIWKSSNIGRWGQTKGPLNSLAKAEPMRKLLFRVVDEFGLTDNSDTWYVLGSLYDQLPGGPISFGNNNYAISYLRLAVETIPDEVWYGGTYQYLAETLHNRDWDAAKRAKEFPKQDKKFKKTKDSEAKKMGFYEGHLGAGHKPVYARKTLGAMSDREEALAVLDYALAVYKKRPFHTQSDEKNLREINDLLSEWR